MRRLLLLALLLSFVGISTTANTGDSASALYPELIPEIQHRRVEQAIRITLNQYHYKNVSPYV